MFFFTVVDFGTLLQGEAMYEGSILKSVSTLNDFNTELAQLMHEMSIYYDIDKYYIELL